jgi:hypothetical protein
MEFLTVYDHYTKGVNERGLQIDLEHYIAGSFVGLLSRFIASDKMFQPRDRSSMTYKEYDKFVINESTRYLTDECAKLAGKDKSIKKQTGLQYRQISRNIEKQAIQSTTNDVIDLLYNDSPQDYIKNMQPNITVDSMRFIEMAKEKGIDIVSLRRIYFGPKSIIGARLIITYNNEIKKLQNWLYDNLDKLITIKKLRREYLNNIILSTRSNQGDENVEIDDLPQEDIEFLTLYKQMKMKLQYYMNLKANTLLLSEDIEKERLRAMYIDKELTNIRTVIKEDSILCSTIDEYQWC